jgi:hypothetical protein
MIKWAGNVKLYICSPYFQTGLFYSPNVLYIDVLVAQERVGV